MSIVRSADMNKTPDVRTRVILERWACRVDVVFVQPLLTFQIVAKLLAASGLFLGVGDWRNQKGAGSYGLYTLVEKDNAEWATIVRTGDRHAQEKAMSVPICYDAETAELLSWFRDEVDVRGRKKQTSEGAEAAGKRKK